MANLKELRQTSLRDMAKWSLRSSIIVGDLSSDQIYTVGEIAKQLGISATPIREALYELANDGLIEVLKNRGFAVKRLSQEDLDEIFYLRRLLEIPIIDKIVENFQAEDCMKVEAASNDCIQAAKARDLPAFLVSDRRFHISLLEVAGQPRITKIVDQLRDQARLYGLQRLAHEDGLLQSALEHELILDAIKRGNRDLAKDLMGKHLIHTRGIWAGIDE